MRRSSMLKIALLAIPLLLSSCASKKKAVQEKPTTTVNMEGKSFLEKVQANAQDTKFISSKVKFSVEVGVQKLTLTGNLKMKRDDVIRLQLMAFGFVEAGRIEFTKDYVLIMDRINKQYLKTPYVQVDFLRNSGLNFNSLQALFWNELFKPVHYNVKNKDEKEEDFVAIESGDDVVISLDDGKMGYSWLADKDNNLLKMANILYKDKFNGNSQLNWDYQDFKQTDQKMFPTKNTITLTTPNTEVKLGMTLNYIKNETEWETRTQVSSKYREVTVDEIIRRFMSL